MKKPLQHFIAAAFVALIAAGCASAPSRFYTLNSTAIGDGTTNNNYAVMVGPVSIPAEVNRPQFTVQVAPGKVRYMINGHLFHQDDDPSPTSPWVG